MRCTASLAAQVAFDPGEGTSVSRVGLGVEISQNSVEFIRQPRLSPLSAIRALHVLTPGPTQVVAASAASIATFRYRRNARGFFVGRLFSSNAIQ